MKSISTTKKKKKKTQPGSCECQVSGREKVVNQDLYHSELFMSGYKN